MFAINVVWQRICLFFLQLFPELNFLIQQRKIKDYENQVRNLEKLVSQTYIEGKQQVEKYSKRLLELHQELVVKEKQIADLTEHATRDSLTGALNRRGADIALVEQVKRMQRNLKGVIAPFPHFGVIALDLDYFKVVNDTFGHDAGDRALLKIVGIAKAIFRSTDIICRSSEAGDEFVIVMTENLNLEQVMERAEVLRAAIAGDDELHFEGFTVTASVGVSTMVLTEMSREEEIAAAFHNAKVEADHAANHSKRNGKNSVNGFKSSVELVKGR